MELFTKLIYAACRKIFTPNSKHFSDHTYPDRVFRVSPSVVRQMAEYNSQRRATARTLPKFLCCSMYDLFCVVLCIVCV